MFLVGPCFIRVLLFLGAVGSALRARPEVHRVGLLGEAFSASCSPRRHGARVVVTDEGVKGRVKERSSETEGTI